MRVKRIMVEGLFGQRNKYDIPLKSDEHVTLMIGENGSGKTTVLRLVDALLNDRQDELASIPFRDLEVELEDGSIIRATQNADRPSDQGPDVVVEILRPEQPNPVSATLGRGEEGFLLDGDVTDVSVLRGRIRDLLVVITKVDDRTLIESERIVASLRKRLVPLRNAIAHGLSQDNNGHQDYLIALPQEIEDAVRILEVASRSSLKTPPEAVNLLLQEIDSLEATKDIVNLYTGKTGGLTNRLRREILDIIDRFNFDYERSSSTYDNAIRSLLNNARLLRSELVKGSLDLSVLRPLNSLKDDIQVLSETIREVRKLVEVREARLATLIHRRYDPYEWGRERVIDDFFPADQSRNTRLFEHEPISARNLASVRLIGTERLVPLGTDSRQDGPLEQASVRSVEANAYDISTRIRESNQKYTAVSQKLDSTYTTRLLDSLKDTNVQWPESPSSPSEGLVRNTRSTRQRHVQGDIGKTGSLAQNPQELHHQLVDLFKRVSTLTDLGVLSKEEKAQVPTASEVDNIVAFAALRLYASDLGEKLESLGPLAERIQALLDVTSDRFKGKRLVVDIERGLFVRTIDGRSLSVSQLSSGEQHLIVLMCELLFRIKPGTLVLIDEPELSLHIAWQRQMIADLMKVASRGKFDILVATHSPDIIYGRWDLTARLNEDQIDVV